MRYISYFLTVASLCLTLVSSEASAQELTDVINRTGEIALEENEEVFTDRVNVRVEDDKLLISDTRENQVREYARDGTLLNYFGADDPEAPGGFWFPSTPLRMSEDTILVPNTGNGSLSLVDENGNLLERHTRIAKSGDFDVAPLPVDGHVLFVGSANGRQGTPNFLHHLDPSSGEVTKSFYPLPDPFGSHAGILYTISPIVNADVYQDRIAVGFLLSDSITLFEADGTPLGEIEPTLSSFEEVEQTEERPERGEFQQELVRRSLFNTLFWLNDETLLVQFTNSYFDDQDERQLNNVLAAVTTEGEVLFEIEDTPRLLAVDQETGDLFFAHPDHDFESHWRVGRIREEVLP
jgi:hypothetical protein